MAFVDEIKIRVVAGNGGNGVVRWLHLKGKEFSGPAGGNGGNGGSVYARGVRDAAALAKLVGVDEIRAQNGEHGRSHNEYGANGEDAYVDVPIGSVITNAKTGAVHEILTEGEMALLAQGGRGGYGNTHFKGSKNIKPMEQTDGKEGGWATIAIEVRLIADVGLIGPPNAGKSTLLNTLTNAQSRIGAYPFTTLEPHLGEFHGHVLADIPGLIEGASEGKGLGHKFLRHISRVKMLLTLIPIDVSDVVAEYQMIRKELAAHDEALTKKPEWVVLTKTDTVGDEATDGARMRLATHTTSPVYAISVLDDAQVKIFHDALIQKLRQ